MQLTQKIPKLEFGKCSQKPNNKIHGLHTLYSSQNLCAIIKISLVIHDIKIYDDAMKYRAQVRLEVSKCSKFFVFKTSFCIYLMGVIWFGIYMQFGCVAAQYCTLG